MFFFVLCQTVCLPASIAFLAASLKWLTMVGISSVLRRLGGVNMASSMPLERIWGINGLSVQEMGACPFGWKPLLETLPTCQIWQKMMPPLAWTASTIGFHASTCSLVHIPGVSWYLQEQETTQMWVRSKPQIKIINFISIEELFCTTNFEINKLNILSKKKKRRRRRKSYPWAVSETPVASVMRRPPGVVLWA